MANIIKSEPPKHLMVPARALPEEKLNAQIAYFVEYLELLIGVKDNEENTRRIAMLLPQVKKEAWSLSVQQLMDAFQLYIDGKLSYNNKPLEPVSGFLDAILFKKVIKAYKEYKPPSDVRKSILLDLWERWKAGEKLADGKFNWEPVKGSSEAFDYLIDRGVLPKKDKTPEIEQAYAQKLKLAQGYLYAPLFDRLKWFSGDSDLRGSAGHKRCEQECKQIREMQHPSITPMWKECVLRGFFEKVKKKGKEIDYYV